MGVPSRTLDGEALRAFVGSFRFFPEFGESLRGNRIGATGLRASERKSASERFSESVSEREGFQRFLRGFERFSEVFRDFREVFRDF